METLNDAGLRQMLEQARVIAVVGHSDDPGRTSYRIASYLRRAGYMVIPVNPQVQMIDGQPSYPSLATVPESIDIVDVFRRSEHLLGIVEQAAAVGAKMVWAQQGVSDPAAARRAAELGIPLVMDNCIMVTHRRLLG